jgi:hypothetical protein
MVARGFVIETADGEFGICGFSAQHARLIATDATAREEFHRLQPLEVERRRAWVSDPKHDRFANGGASAH